MNFLKHLFIFIQNNMKQLKRKYYILPLLLLFPLVLISGIIFLLVTFFSVSVESTVHLGVVNEDGSRETEIIVQVLEETEQFGPFIEVDTFDRATAEEKVYDDDLSAYIVLPEGFTDDLYRGSSVSMDIIGNPKKEVDSNVIYQLVDSFMRHIRTSQANILLVNEYAKKLPMSDAERSDLVMDEFIKTFLNVAGKDRLITEEKVENQTTSSPVKFFIISLFYLTVTIWLFIFYHFLYEDDEKRMVKRMRLYGVTDVQRILARSFVTLVFTAIWAIGLWFVIDYFFEFNMEGENMARLGLLLTLYSIFFVLALACLEVLIRSPRIRLLTHVLFTIVFIVLSGAIIPAIYFPLYIQDLLSYLSSFEALFWTQEIMLNGRFMASYRVSIVSSLILVLLFILLGKWKERDRV